MDLSVETARETLKKDFLIWQNPPTSPAELSNEADDLRRRRVRRQTQADPQTVPDLTILIKHARKVKIMLSWLSKCCKSKTPSIKTIVGHIGFKVSRYSHDDPRAKQAENSQDWSGFYIAEKEEVARGYIPDCFDEKGSGDAYLYKVILKEPHQVVQFDDRYLGQADIESKKKAEFAKGKLGSVGIKIDIEKPLIPQLGENNYFYKALHDKEGNYEIIVPSNLTHLLTLVEIGKFKSRDPIK